MDVVVRRQERVEVAGRERASTRERELRTLRPVELLVLVAPVEADEPPRQMVVHGSHRAGRDDEAEQRERAIGGAEEEPLADATSHAALCCRLLVTLRKPVAVLEQPGEKRLDRFAGLRSRGRTPAPP